MDSIYQGVLDDKLKAELDAMSPGDRAATLKAFSRKPGFDDIVRRYNRTRDPVDDAREDRTRQIIGEE
jgi:hypothetical protein